MARLFFGGSNRIYMLMFIPIESMDLELANGAHIIKNGSTMNKLHIISGKSFISF